MNIGGVTIAVLSFLLGARAVSFVVFSVWIGDWNLRTSGEGRALDVHDLAFFA